MREYLPVDDGIAEEDLPSHPFRMAFKRNGVIERHEFEARPVINLQSIRGLVPVMSRRRGGGGLPTGVITSIDKLIRRSLRNDDGTPVDWEPQYTEDGQFFDPNGDLCEAELLDAYLTFDAGSSRRRWMYLMDDDDDVTIEDTQIMELVTDLMKVAGDRPTKRSAPSSR